ncbi:MAG: acyltransferase [Muribaculaceae bacterium]|nr:acyltransferase [Muribaculaceae bacterium]
MEQIKPISSKRIPYLDTLRVLACLMVILVHSPHPHEGMTDALSYGIISFICSPCIGLFLMISGALLLPIKTTIKEYLSKRLPRIIFPLISWSLIYIIIALCLGNISWDKGLQELINIPFGCVTGFAHGWYLYLLIGIYLILPIFNSWLSDNGKQRSLFYLIFWAITLASPYFIAIIGKTIPLVFTYFTGFLGYVILGYYLHRYPIKLSTFKHWIIFISITICFGLIMPAIVYLSNIPNYDTYNLIIYNYQAIHTVILCIFIFVCIQNYNPKSNKFQLFMNSISTLSFGIYLVNFTILRDIFKPYFMQNPVYPVELEIAITFISSTILSYAIIWCINKLPFKKFLIG